MSNESDLLHTWRAAANRPNVLVLAPATASYVPHLLELRENEQFEVVHLEHADAALRLLRRGLISVLVLEGRPTEPGALELLVEAVNKETPPRVLVFSDKGSQRGALEVRQVRRVRIPMEKSALHKLIQNCAAEFLDPAMPLTAAEVLEAAQELPDEGWLRITNKISKAADFCVRAGHAIYVESEGMKGEQAAASVITWQGCRFELRELPGYLEGNMDVEIGILRTSPAPNPWKPSPVVVVDDAPPAIEDNGVFLMPEVLAPPESEPESTADPDTLNFAEPGSMDWTDDESEPDDFPAFPGEAPEFEALVEEPSEFNLQFDGFEAGLEAVATAVSPEPPPPGTPSSQSSLFAAAAILPEVGAVLESCLPASEAATFEASWLRTHYRQAEQYILARGLGDPVAVPMITSQGGIVVAPLHGTGRLLAVKLRAPNFGDAEREELKRLQQSALDLAALAPR